MVVGLGGLPEIVIPVVSSVKPPESFRVLCCVILMPPALTDGVQILLIKGMLSALGLLTCRGMTGFQFAFALAWARHFCAICCKCKHKHVLTRQLSAAYYFYSRLPSYQCFYANFIIFDKETFVEKL